MHPDDRRWAHAVKQPTRREIMESLEKEGNMSEFQIQATKNAIEDCGTEIVRLQCQLDKIYAKERIPTPAFNTGQETKERLYRKYNSAGVRAAEHHAARQKVEAELYAMKRRITSSELAVMEAEINNDTQSVVEFGEYLNDLQVKLDRILAKRMEVSELQQDVEREKQPYFKQLVALGDRARAAAGIRTEMEKERDRVAGIHARIGVLTKRKEAFEDKLEKMLVETGEKCVGED